MRFIVQTCFMLLLLTGCRSTATLSPPSAGANTTETWSLAFFTPQALSAEVTYVAVIDMHKEMYTYRTLHPVEGSLRSVGSWSDRVRRGPQLKLSGSRPVAMLFCWDSIIDKKTYETHVTLPDNLFEQALAYREKKHSRNSRKTQSTTTWDNTLLLGLAPQGKVRIWLQNNQGGDNLPLEPKNIRSLSGEQLDVCKGITVHSLGYQNYGERPNTIRGRQYPYGNW